MSLILETRDLAKTYGQFQAVKGMSLQVEQGAIYGFVGPNGAGKTTTMRIITTLLEPTSGEAYVGGHSVRSAPDDVRRLIGYMPDFFGVYDDMTVWEYLDFFAACYKVPDVQRRRLIDDLLELVDLGHKRDVQVDTLSRGMKQRLCLARTLAHDPQVLILDEPASGLDPRARVEIRELLVELSRMGKTVFFSTHILADVAEICTHIGIVEGGRLVAQGSMTDMQRQLRPHRTLRVQFLALQDVLTRAQSVVFGREGVLAVRPIDDDEGPPTLEVDFGGDAAGVSSLLSLLVAQKLPVLHFSETRQELEDVFMQITNGARTS
ncbi:MAG TPA: ABC transporter ATP-binding protein [Anaerolineales bacterium]|nr:ABC transporter ATP-binding protein [Anaerolineales bacterium]